MTKQQLRARVFGALFAGVFAFGATATYAADVEAFDTVEDAFSAEAEQNADFLDMNDSSEEGASVGEFGGGYYPYPPFPVPHRGRFVCVAQNLRGQAFYGRDRLQHQARNEALANCYRARSASCQVTSCRFVRN